MLNSHAEKSVKLKSELSKIVSFVIAACSQLQSKSAKVSSKIIDCYKQKKQQSKQLEQFPNKTVSCNLFDKTQSEFILTIV